ncbi:MAG: DNA methyltransferase [Thermoanaerobaculia bacterium]
MVGNPPFLGGKLLRRELGDDIRRSPLCSTCGSGARADLCCYWFERARKALTKGASQRVGLLAMQGIRGGANRRVLERIKETGDIFWAWSDREWILDSAAVHVSMVGFDLATEPSRLLDGAAIHQTIRT